MAAWWVHKVLISTPYIFQGSALCFTESREKKLTLLLHSLLWLFLPKQKQQARARRRITEREARRQAAEGPYCIENDMNGMSNVDIDIPRPPSYFEVIGFFDPPPSYNDVLRVGGSASQQQVEANQVRDPSPVSIFSRLRLLFFFDLT